ncbi:MAG: hypothetical protein M9953_12005 [Thermomicrobiales bacterium]|nr:hypothetical protein [Thermomicrobiales bacterium]
MNMRQHLITLMLICMVAIPSVAAETSTTTTGCEQLLSERVPNEIVKQMCATTDECGIMLGFTSTQVTCSDDGSTVGTSDAHCAANASSSHQIPTEILRQVAYAEAEQTC